jgi:hypothetical protein
MNPCIMCCCSMIPFGPAQLWTAYSLRLIANLYKCSPKDKFALLLYAGPPVRSSKHNRAFITPRMCVRISAHEAQHTFETSAAFATTCVQCVCANLQITAKSSQYGSDKVNLGYWSDKAKQSGSPLPLPWRTRHSLIARAMIKFW